ncbi:MAG TPA: heparan-alpha-glucosaminide N-acetyltransferase domain-containing protein [Candidatus Acidoferrum sp.]|jgi:uncharacterized membrane protein
MSAAPAAPVKRLAYIDWMRGFACVLMIQAHCYDSWLNPEARKTWLYRWSQETSTMAAPIFLFLCGVSFALVTEGLQKKNAPRREIFKTAVRRGGEILGFGFLLRVQEFVLGFPKSPWTDILRVDVLNILGISILLMALFWWTTREPAIGYRPPSSIAIGLALGIAALIALVTPPLWTTHRPRFLPWMLESYINGVHTYDAPKPWIFSIFPWCGFAFVGLAFGWFLFTKRAQRNEPAELTAVAGVGAVACALSLWWDYSRVHIYAVYDYWHSSPNFFLMRCGILLLLTFAVFVWCRWGSGARGFSLCTQFGKTSLLVYWAHIEFVYGRLSILPKGRSNIPLATAGMVVIFLAMLWLSVWRTRSKQRATSGLGAMATPSTAQV